MKTTEWLRSIHTAARMLNRDCMGEAENKYFRLMLRAKPEQTSNKWIVSAMNELSNGEWSLYLAFGSNGRFIRMHRHPMPRRHFLEADKFIRTLNDWRL